ncbi:GNAT family N-acetyltransferase [Alteribacter keqinensis]|uniref:GNAT family N-acetyltransferase n=1 Tax=Alteribacter keqinensis TaxID=2483800 RepID=A0A3M7TX22_9BACI|nr:GNAT family N-acetyltransferase [Alteribacter keqinensis]RNA70126.1 GNAT family N-acetyltransferase [Alteribacter keqinensis]
MIVKEMVSLSDMNHLLEESEKEGFRFLRRLADDYDTGANRFNELDEFLLGVYSGSGQLVAIGGLNRDPFSGDQAVGRIRRFYVSSEWRGRGIGRLLLNELIRQGKEHFHAFTLFTDTPEADKFYISCGFKKGTAFLKSTHFYLVCQESDFT